MKVKFCQFELWMLYCTSVLLSGKLFRIKTCLWQILSPLICCTSPSPVNWFTLFSRWRFYLLPLTTSRCRIKGEQCSLLCRRRRATLGWESLESSQYACTSWCTPFLLGMLIASFCNPLGSNPASQQSLKTTLVLLQINPLDWTDFRLKTATFEILLNDKFPPELSLLVAQNETHLASSETWAWRYEFSISRLNVYVPTECSYF